MKYESVFYSQLHVEKKINRMACLIKSKKEILLNCRLEKCRTLGLSWGKGSNFK